MHGTDPICQERGDPTKATRKGIELAGAGCVERYKSGFEREGWEVIPSSTPPNTGN